MQFELAAPAPRVWALLEDFGAIARWWPRDAPAPIVGVELDGEGVGMVRRIHNAGMANPVLERLDLCDVEERRLVLSIVGDRPLGLTAYVAEGRVVPLGEARSRLDYRAVFTLADAARTDSVRRALGRTWETMARGLEHTARE